MLSLPMYIPKHFEQPRTEVLHQLMRARPLATLITQTADGFDANHIPLHLSCESADSPGILRGHVARANPLWKEAGQNHQVLAIFHGPDAYVTPSWYPSKAETGKAVPTWNYAVVHAHGALRIIDDANWLRAHLDALTASQESGFAHPWQVSDAPEDYISNMIKAVVGIEITITRLSGKWKLSQNQPAQNQAGVIAGLRAQDSESDEGKARALEMAKWVNATRDAIGGAKP
jgi:transcriptional regulator